MAGPATLGDFEGLWLLERKIDDLRAGQVGRLVGTAQFEWSGDVLIYQEVGKLQIGAGVPVRATRAYRWQAGEGGVEVEFDDGRPFHSFPLKAAPMAKHFCDPDMYSVCYEFSAWPNWRAEWTVNGPRKSYVMTSHYARAA